MKYIKSWNQFNVPAKIEYKVFFTSNPFIGNVRLKSAKNQTNVKQHREAELLLFQNYTFFIHAENNRTYSKQMSKQQMCLYSWDYAINHCENEDENEK